MKTVTKEDLVEFLDLVDPLQYDAINSFLWQCLPTDEATLDEIEAIECGRAEFAAGDFVRESDLPVEKTEFSLRSCVAHLYNSSLSFYRIWLCYTDRKRTSTLFFRAESESKSPKSDSAFSLSLSFPKKTLSAEFTAKFSTIQITQAIIASMPAAICRWSRLHHFAI